jgi:hypothetical protein
MLRPASSILVEVGRFSALMRPPATRRSPTGKSVSPRRWSPAGQPAAAIVLAELDALLCEPRYVAVAHHASTEANILAR